MRPAVPKPKEVRLAREPLRPPPPLSLSEADAMRAQFSALSDPSIPAGGRLMRFSHRWATLLAPHTWVVDTVTHGLRISWDPSGPARLRRLWPAMAPWPVFPPHVPVAQLLEIKFNSMLASEVIEEVTDQDSVAVVSTVFPVPKGPDDLRPVFNLRWLNQYIVADHFKMEDMRTAIALMRPGDWFTKVDIKDAFTHVPMWPPEMPYLVFRWGGRLYRYRTMPFGLSTAPRTFTKLLRPIAAFLRAKGVRLVVYIDDILLMAGSREESSQHTRWLLELLSYLGFLVNWPKSVLEPTTTIEFLGFVLDSQKMLIALPPNKLKSLRHRVGLALEAASLPLRSLASLVGTLNASAMAVMPTRLRTRALLRDKIDALHAAQGTWRGVVSLTPASMAELRWWRDELENWNGRSLQRSEPDLAMYSDASNSGWGAVLGSQTAFGHWDASEAQLHINELELRAVLLGMRSFLPAMRGRTVLLRVDNMVAVAYLNHQGGTHSPRLSAVAQDVWNLALSEGILLEAQHIPGVENVDADAASRQNPARHEWCLHPRIFRQVDRRYGPFTVDLFATVLNRQLPRYYSWRPDPETSGLDALQQSWSTEAGYANPPWILIPDILRKISSDSARVLLIAPVWPSQAWYPTMLALLRAPPTVLPTAPADLFCPDRSPWAVDAPEIPWIAAAWPLSGVGFETTAYRRGLPSWPASGGPTGPDAITIQPGPGGTAGVFNNRWIRFADR